MATSSTLRSCMPGGVLVLALAGAFAGSLQAQPRPSIAEQPAATLLLPYFEVDLQNPGGVNTVFSVNNASASAALVNVTVWSAMHVPVYNFPVYLTGYDMQTFDVRAILDGQLPRTASDGQDPADTANQNDGISNQGNFSQDINFASCSGVLPLAPVSQSQISHMRASLTGAASPLTGMCASLSDGTQVARGYVTVDSVTQCTDANPSTPGYFAGIADSRNILWGDAVYTSFIGGTESGDGVPLVHVRADTSDPETTTPGEYTFYGRFVNWTAADAREPLATSFGARFSTGGTFGSTSLTVWRDNKTPQNAFACGTQPAWFPLGQELITFFDEQEQVEVVESVPFAPPNLGGGAQIIPFPAATQRVVVGGAAMPTSKTFGWVYLNLSTSIASAGANPSEDPAASQAWVNVHMKGIGRYSVGWSAVMLDSAKDRLAGGPGAF